MSSYGKADTRTQWFADNYTGSTMDPNCGCLHSTETTDWPSYSGGATAPNLTAKPDSANKRILWRQHYPDEMSARALQNDAGGVETNTANVVQVELIGTCDPSTRDRWRREGRKQDEDFIFWPEAPEWALRGVAELIADYNKRHGIKIQGPAKWAAYPGSYGQSNPNRMTFGQWHAFYGWCGHQHVPENDHGDPGNLPWATIADMARELVGPAPGPEPRQLVLGSFNVERARPKKAAVGDVVRLFDKWELAGLAVQEAEQYFHELDHIPGLRLFADGQNPENGILVPEGRGTAFLAADYGDGWTREHGAHRGPGIFPRVTIDDWCRLASVHYPPSTTWPGGVLHTPDARRDDVIEIAEMSKAFLDRPNLTRVVAGDWNEPPTTAGTYSPLWLARETGSQIQAPKSRKGHGRIDFAITNRGRMVNVRKDTEIREGSDHEPVIFTVIETQ